jgi:hypothetical protein
MALSKMNLERLLALAFTGIIVSTIDAQEQRSSCTFPNTITSCSAPTRGASVEWREATDSRPHQS